MRTAAGGVSLVSMERYKFGLLLVKKLNNQHALTIQRAQWERVDTEESMYTVNGEIGARNPHLRVGVYFRQQCGRALVDWPIIRNRTRLHLSHHLVTILRTCDSANDNVN